MVWIYRLLFLCVCVCTVTDFSGEDKASGVKFCTVVHQRPGQGMLPRSPKSDESASRRKAKFTGHILSYRKRHATDAPFVEYRAACGRRIGMCGYTVVPEDRCTCWYRIQNDTRQRHIGTNITKKVLLPRDPRDALYQLICWPTVVRMMQTDRVSA